MKVKIPKEIKIGIYPYRIAFKPHLRDDEGYIGIANFRTGEINLLPQLNRERLGVALLHELIHIIEDTYHFNISEQDNFRIAEGLAEFLFNNLGIEFGWGDIKEE